MTVSPRVSVLMSVYNGARYLREAMDSILNQTFTDFEFIVVDDGSTDETPAILDSYADPRVVRLHNETNIGLTRSLNRGLAVAKGEYVARQDADDVSLPERLQKQVAFLDAHPKVAAVGTAYIEVPVDGGPERLMVMPTASQAIREQLFYTHCFCHGSVMLRRNAMVVVGGYDENFQAAQDRDLWLRLAERFDLANLDEPLYRLRMSAGSVTGSMRARQREGARRAVRQALQRGRLNPSAKAIGRFYWLEALDAFADNHREAARIALEQCVGNYPTITEDRDWLLYKAVHQAFEVVNTSPSNPEAGFVFLKELFALLPSGMASLQMRQGWTFGELSAACAFLYARRGDVKAVRHFCLKAWRSSIEHWRNLGLLSTFIRSWGTSVLKPVHVRG